jgi:hypothetical protein
VELSVKPQGVDCRVYASGDWGSGFGVRSLGFRVAGFRIESLGLRV